MKMYELDAEQNQTLEKAFLMMPHQDGAQQKVEAAINKLQQTAKYLMTLTKKSKEQNQMILKLQEAALWAQEAVKKHEF